MHPPTYSRMLKTAALAMIGIALSPAIVAAVPPANSQANLMHFGDGDLTCFMRTADGRTLDLNSICGNNARSGGITTSSTAIHSTGSLGGLEAYRGSATAPLCFGLDAQGQPCSPAQ